MCYINRAVKSISILVAECLVLNCAGSSRTTLVSSSPCHPFKYNPQEGLQCVQMMRLMLRHRKWSERGCESVLRSPGTLSPTGWVTSPTRHCRGCQRNSFSNNTMTNKSCVSLQSGCDASSAGQIVCCAWAPWRLQPWWAHHGTSW
jgi:hypothetical protein